MENLNIKMIIEKVATKSQFKESNMKELLGEAFKGDNTTDKLLMNMFNTLINIIPEKTIAEKFFIACKYKNIDTIKSILQDNKIDDLTVHGYTILYKINDVDICKLLLTYNPDVNYIETDIGYTPLMVNQDIEICKLLLENGANINYQNKQGATSLIISVAEKQLDKVKFLLDSKADYTLKCIDGTDIGMFVKDANNEELTKLVENYIKENK